MGIKKGLTHAPEEMSELKDITLNNKFKSGKGKFIEIENFQISGFVSRFFQVCAYIFWIFSVVCWSAGPLWLAASGWLAGRHGFILARYMADRHCGWPDFSRLLFFKFLTNSIRIP